LHISDFVDLEDDDRVIDLGTGNGIIAILLSLKNTNIKVTGVEIQKKLVSIAKRNAVLNQVENRVEILHCDLKKIDEILPPSSFTVAVSNPPFVKFNEGIISPNIERAIARHEIEVTLEYILRAAYYLLINGGRLYLCYPGSRLKEITDSMKLVDINPCGIRYLTRKDDPRSDIFIVKGVKTE